MSCFARCCGRDGNCRATFRAMASLARTPPRCRVRLGRSSRDLSVANINVVRERAFLLQQGRCHYCKVLMIPVARVPLVPRCARLLAATAEHLRARSAGGTDVAANVVAACLYCNATRHRSKRPLDYERYLLRVRRRVASEQWPTHGWADVCRRFIPGYRDGGQLKKGRG